MKINGLIIRCLLLFWLSFGIAAADTDDAHVPGMRHATHSSTSTFTVIPYDYYQLTQHFREEITDLLQRLQGQHDANQIVKQAGQYFLDRPYSINATEGEGDWCNQTQRGCAHIRQDPIYRTDVFDCQTLVQTILALFHANNIDNYEKNILRIEYGAAHEPPTSIHFYNRNNFASGDFNPVNEANGVFADATNQGVFAQHTKTTSALIDRQQWFLSQENPEDLANNVRVIHGKDGPAMVKRFTNKYPAPFHIFAPEKVSIDYIPKELIVKKIKTDKGDSYQPDEQLINQIPTPAVIEIVRDVKKWYVNGVNIKDLIGSELNVSHMGFLYRDHFAHGDLIYQKITCDRNASVQKVCRVTPVFCEQAQGCTKTMFLHATDGYPQGYYYYKNAEGDYRCTAEKPSAGIKYTTCNRVLALPLGDYFTTYRYRKYIYMLRPSILGIHIEKIRY